MLISSLPVPFSDLLSLESLGRFRLKSDLYDSGLILTVNIAF